MLRVFVYLLICSPLYAQPADIVQLVEMGFDETRARTALRRAGNDVLLASNYLADGTVS